MFKKMMGITLGGILLLGFCPSFGGQTTGMKTPIALGHRFQLTVQGMGEERRLGPFNTATGLTTLPKTPQMGTEHSRVNSGKINAPKPATLVLRGAVVKGDQSLVKFAQDISKTSDKTFNGVLEGFDSNGNVVLRVEIVRGRFVSLKGPSMSASASQMGTETLTLSLTNFRRIK